MNDTPQTSFAPLDPLATGLCRKLYAAGLPITADQATRFIDALAMIGPLSESRLYFTARTVFVSHPEQLPAFDQAFSSLLVGERQPAVLVEAR